MIFGMHLFIFCLYKYFLTMQMIKLIDEYVSRDIPKMMSIQFKSMLISNSFFIQTLIFSQIWEDFGHDQNRCKIVSGCSLQKVQRFEFISLILYRNELVPKILWIMRYWNHIRLISVLKVLTILLCLTHHFLFGLKSSSLSHFSSDCGFK